MQNLITNSTTTGPEAKVCERYLSKHFKSMRSTWNSHWLANGKTTRPNTCLEECWKSLVAYWKTPIAIVESLHMVKVQDEKLL